MFEIFLADICRALTNLCTSHKITHIFFWFRYNSFASKCVVVTKIFINIVCSYFSGSDCTNYSRWTSCTVSAGEYTRDFFYLCVKSYLKDIPFCRDPNSSNGADTISCPTAIMITSALNSCFSFAASFGAGLDPR